MVVVGGDEVEGAELAGDASVILKAARWTVNGTIYFVSFECISEPYFSLPHLTCVTLISHCLFWLVRELSKVNWRVAESEFPRPTSK